MYTVILLTALMSEPSLQPMPGCHGLPARSTTVERSYQLVPQEPKLMLMEKRTTTTVRAACSGSAGGCSGASSRTGLFSRLRERGGLFRGGCR